MEDKWIWPVLLLAFYLYSAYAANKKKQEEAKKQQGGGGETKPQRHFNPTPTSQSPKPFGDVFREIFGEENFPKPKPAPKPALPTKSQKKAPLKPVTKPPILVSAIEEVHTEGERTTSDIHSASSKQTKEAYDISKLRESNSFNAREAFIGSIILNRPEY